MERKHSPKIFKFSILIVFVIVIGSVAKVLSFSNNERENREKTEFIIPELDTINENMLETIISQVDDLQLTGSEKAALKRISNQNLVVGCVSDKYNCFTVNGIHYGTSKMLFDVINETLNLNLTLEPSSTDDGIPEALDRISAGEHSMILNFSPTEERLKRFNFSENVFSYNTFFYSTKHSNINFHDLLGEADPSLPKTKIGFIAGSSFLSNEFLEDNNMEAVYFQTNEDAMKELNKTNPEISGFIRMLSDDFIKEGFNIENINRYRDKYISGVLYEKENPDLDILMKIIPRIFTDELSKIIDSEKDKITKLKFSLGHFFTDEEKLFLENSKDITHPLVSLKTDNKIITVGSNSDGSEVYDGLGYEITKNIFELSGMKYSLTPLATVDELTTSLQKGESLAAIGLDKTNSRIDLDLQFSKPFFTSNFSVYGEFSNNYVLTTNNLRFSKLGYVKSYSYNEKILDVEYPNHNFIEFDTMDDLISGFTEGEIDFFISEESSYDLFYFKKKMFNLEKKLTFYETCSSYECSYRPSITFTSNDKYENSSYALSIVNKATTVISFVAIEQKYDYSIDMNEVIELDVLEYRTNLYLFSILGTSILVFILIFVFYEKNKNSKKMLYYDDLTGLYNRRKLVDDFELTRYKYKTLNYIDLNKLKFINDNFGHKEGDNYLKTFSSIVLSLGDDAQGYRIGGDEFVVLLKKSILPEQLNKLIDSNKSSNKYKMSLNLSIGSLLLENYKTDRIEKLLIYADKAMYISKNSSSTNITFVTKSIVEDAKLSNFIEQKSNILGEKLGIHSLFQPIIDLKSLNVSGVEILARCEINGESVLPEHFLKHLRKNNTIAAMDLEMFENGLKLLTDLRKRNIVDNNFFISSNFSPVSITNIPIDTFIEISSKYNIDRHLMHLEVTEEILASEETIRKILRLKEEGFSVSIDDFTAGHSSFNYLFKMSPNTIKFDKELITLSSFEENLKFKEAFSALVTSVSASDSHIIIEGIETKEQLDFIRDTSIGYAQGYYFSKPLNLEKLRIYIANNSTKKAL